MRLGLNGATIMHTDLIMELNIANKAGFEISELRDVKLRAFLQGHSMADLKDYLKTVTVKPVNINALEPVTFVSEKDWEELEERTEWFCSNSAAMGCESIPVVPGKIPPGATAEDCFEESVKALKRIAPFAANYGLGLSFEFIGFNDFTVRSMVECQRIIDAANKAVRGVKIGMVFDFIHYFAGEVTLDDLKQVGVGSIDIVHLCDASPVSLETHQVSDGNRLLPGDGIMDSEGLLKTLVDLGYDGAYSVEIFNEDIWNMDPVQVANDTYAKSMRLLSAYYS